MLDRAAYGRRPWSWGEALRTKVALALGLYWGAISGQAAGNERLLKFVAQWNETGFFLKKSEAQKFVESATTLSSKTWTLHEPLTICELYETGLNLAHSTHSLSVVTHCSTKSCTDQNNPQKATSFLVKPTVGQLSPSQSKGNIGAVLIGPKRTFDATACQSIKLVATVKSLSVPLAKGSSQRCPYVSRSHSLGDLGLRVERVSQDKKAIDADITDMLRNACPPSLGPAKAWVGKELTSVFKKLSGPATDDFWGD